MSESKETDWKEVATELLECVNMALMNLKATGSGLIGDKKTKTFRHWKEWFADAMEKHPGIKVDRKVMRIYDLPRSKQRKAFADLEKKREALKQENKE